MQQMALWEDTGKIINVASVPQRSPFRYPGGKTWLVPRIKCWLESLHFKPKKFIEPFAGGAIVGLTVAFENLADTVILSRSSELLCTFTKWEQAGKLGRTPLRPGHLPCSTSA
jgi:hypothetical protein